MQFPISLVNTVRSTGISSCQVVISMDLFRDMPESSLHSPLRGLCCGEMALRDHGKSLWVAGTCLIHMYMLFAVTEALHCNSTTPVTSAKTLPRSVTKATWHQSEKNCKISNEHFFSQSVVGMLCTAKHHGNLWYSVGFWILKRVGRKWKEKGERCLSHKFF